MNTFRYSPTLILQIRVATLIIARKFSVKYVISVFKESFQINFEGSMTLGKAYIL